MLQVGIPRQVVDLRVKESTRKILTAIIQKQMELIGHRLGIDKARHLPNVDVGDHGEVRFYSGDPNEIVEALLSEYSSLTGEAAYYFSKKVVEQLQKTDPDITMPKVLAEFTPKSQSLISLSQKEAVPSAI